MRSKKLGLYKIVSLIAATRNDAMNSGPEFFNDKGAAVENEIGQPALPGLVPGPVFSRVIGRRDAG